MSKKALKVGFIGNPNCGKTTLFNAYTGAKLKVANWPGVTVEKKEGRASYEGMEFQLIDLPGIYSLTSYTMEEMVSRNCIMSDDVDIIIDVVDASSLERNLYLTLQLIELGKPVVLALNMMDIVEERGMEIDFHRLPEMLGVPAIPVCARKGEGLEILLHAVAHHAQEKGKDPLIHHHHKEEIIPDDIKEKHENYTMVYSADVEEKICLVRAEIEKKYPEIQNPRWTAVKILEKDAEVMKDCPVQIAGVTDESLEKEIINQKYNFIEEIMEESLVHREEKSLRTDRIDSYLTHKVLGLPIFLGIMALIFFLTFTIGDWLKGFMETGLESFSGFVSAGLLSAGAGKLMVSLIVDGAIAGVGSILTFLPNIFILFLALAFLEDSGYMARVAYVMDDFMGHFGLSGKAFIPLLLGFGCTVPAVMASRALKDPKDRLRTILVTPFMSCSARLPIYVLLSGIFFPKNPMLVCYFMYLLGIVTAVLTSIVLAKVSGSKADQSLIMELPEYKAPNARTISIYVWEKIKDYLMKAGTVIFIASIGMWVILHTGPMGYAPTAEESFGAVLGRLLVPVLKPCGLGYWQVAAALVAGLTAKEALVSSLSILFGGSSREILGTALLSMGFGKANALAFMVFCLLYVPCIAAMATIRKETGSRKVTLGITVYQLVIAWLLSFLMFITASAVL